MNCFVHHIPAVDGRKTPQDLEIEERDAASRPGQLLGMLRRFLEWIEQHGLEPHLLFVFETHRSKANRVANVEGELTRLLPYFPDDSLHGALGFGRHVLRTSER